MEKIVLQVKPEFHKNNNKYFKYLGVIWLILGIGMVIDQNLFGWFYLALGVIHYLFHNKIDHSIHSTITNGIYKHNTWFASKTNLLKAQNEAFVHQINGFEDSKIQLTQIGNDNLLTGFSSYGFLVEDGEGNFHDAAYQFSSAGGINRLITNQTNLTTGENKIFLYQLNRQL